MWIEFEEMDFFFFWNPKMDYLFRTKTSESPIIAMLWMQKNLDTTFYKMQWYGKGPQETYWDQKQGVFHLYFVFQIILCKLSLQL